MGIVVVLNDTSQSEYIMQDSQPLVSVIIPAYNHESYVQEAIHSVINQSYANIELIVLDDGSPDTTWQKILELQQVATERFVRVAFETQKNQGTCTTMNTLIQKTQGKYVYLLASDDIAKPHAIQTLVAFLEENPEYGLCVGDNELIDEHGTRIYWDADCNAVYNKEEAVFLTVCDIYKVHRPELDLLSEQYGNYVTLMKNNYVSNGYLLRKSVLDVIGAFTPQAPLEDYWLMLQIAKCAKMKYFPEVLFSYRWHQDNTAKKRDHMENITKKTFEYEKIIVSNNERSWWSKEFCEYIDSYVVSTTYGEIKYRFQIIVEYRIHKTLHYYKLFDRFLGNRQVRCKNLLTDESIIFPKEILP